MLNRKLTVREEEILDMIRPTTFQDIVDAVRRDIEYSKYNAKKELRNLYNGTKNDIKTCITSEITNGLQMVEIG